MKRFTAYRRNISQRATHNEFQKNPDETEYHRDTWKEQQIALRRIIERHAREKLRRALES